MVRGKYLMIAIVLATVGLWGCNQANNGGQAERIRALETKIAKLEDDYRAAATVRDQARKKAQTLEEELAQVQKDFAAHKKQAEADQEEAKLVIKERNELRQIVESRTGERDVLQARCERLKKGLQSLLGQDEAATAAPPPPVTTGTANLGGQSE
jgi:outer membrane murein-binding lipoprotein Lpp